MTNDQSIMHGVDLEQFEAFATHASEQPEEVQFGLQASATYEGTCAHSLAKVGEYSLGGESIRRDTRTYTVPYGAWREVLEAGGWVGATDRLEPIEAALSALAACINVGISVNAVAAGVDIEDLETRVRTEFDPSVLFNLADLNETEGVFENVTAEIRIDGDELEKDLVDEWARRAPVYTLVSLGQDIELNIESAATIPSDD